MNRMREKYLKCELHKAIRETAARQLQQHNSMFFEDVVSRSGFHTWDPQQVWWDYVKEDLEKLIGPLTAVNDRIKRRNAQMELGLDPSRFLSGPYRPAIGYCTNAYMGGVLAVQRLRRQDNVANGLKRSVNEKAEDLRTDNLLPEDARTLLPSPEA